MIKKLFIYLPLISLFLLLSCNTNDKNKTYFGGQIINPKTDYIVFFEKETAIDTFYLKENNRFFAEFDSKKEGLYYFKHANEFQYIYLEPNDSLQLRLNTLDFDESLVFSGKGGGRNNFLIDCFIDSEKESKKFYNYYKLNPEKFTSKVDSLVTIKKRKYNEFASRNEDETDACMDFLDVALYYPLYSKIENYALNHARILKLDSFPQIPSNFYRHRENINLNKENLIYYSVYSNYLTNYLYNKTYATGFNPKIRDYSPNFTKKILEVTETNIDEKSSKNILLKQEIKYHFFRNSENIISKDVFDTYFSLNSNKEFEDQIKNLVSDANQLKINGKVSNFKVLDYTNSRHNIETIINNKNSVIYFWNPKHISENFIASRVKYLSSKNKNVQFIGIKIDGNNSSHIERLDIKNQYFINNKSDANSFLKSKLPRVILIDKSGKIKNSFASMSSRKIFKQVEELNNNN